MKTLNQLLFVSGMTVMCAIFGASQTAAQDSEKKSNSSVQVKYDKKKDLTTVRLKPFRISPLILEKEASSSTPLHQTDLEISYVFAGQQATKPVEAVTFRFQISSSNYTFLRPQTAMAVLNNDVVDKGRAFALGNSDYKSYPPKFNSVYEETLTVNALPDVLRKMAKANSLQLYLGPVPYGVKKEQLDAIKELAALLPAETAAKSN